MRNLLFQLYKDKRLCLLRGELSELHTFSRMLKVRNRRIHLLQIFQVKQITIQLFLAWFFMPRQYFTRNKLIERLTWSFMVLAQALMDHGTKIGTELAIGYSLYCLAARKTPAAHENVINLGLRLGGFLSDAGWYSESEGVLLACKGLCLAGADNPETWCRTLDCCHKWSIFLTFTKRDANLAGKQTFQKN